MKALFKRILRQITFKKRGISAWGYLWGHTRIYDTAEIGDNVSIGYFSEIGNNVKIGRNTRIGFGVFIPEGVEIGENCFIGPGTYFSNDKYPPSPKAEWRHTIICENVSIGAGVRVLPGISIRENSIIGMGSVVTKNIPASSKWCGVPAKEIK